MRILVCIQPGHGHLRPVQPLIDSVRDKHHVTVASSEKFGSAVAAIDCELAPVGINWVEADLDEMFPDVRRPTSKRSIEIDVFAGATALAALPDIERYVEREQPDLIVRSPWEFASCVVARRAGIPLVSVNPTLFGRRPFNRMFNKPMSELMGVRCKSAYNVVHDFPTVLTVPASFVLPHEVIPPNTQWCQPGPASEARPVTNVVPFIHVSLGTVVHRPDLYQVVLDALRPIECNVVVAAPAAVTRHLAAAPSIEFRDYVNHNVLLPTCDLFIHHGGIGSVLTALRHQTPSVILPGWADQPRNAQACAQMGVGIPVLGENQDVSTIRRAIASTLANQSDHRAQLAQIAREMTARPPIGDLLPWISTFGDQPQ